MDSRNDNHAVSIQSKAMDGSLPHVNTGHYNKGFDLQEEVIRKKSDDGNISITSSSKENLQYKKDDKSGMGLRHVLNLMSCTALTICYMNRSNLNIAIVAMVSSSNTSHTEVDDGNFCPLPDEGNGTNTDVSEGEFDWDEQTQGILLGCFYYGYTVSNIFAGLAAEYFGGRLLLGCCVITTSLLSLISPLCARTSTGLFIAIRVLSGFAQGPLFPTIFNLMAAWIPAQERARFSALFFPGAHVGTVLTMSLGGLLASTDFLGGWPLIFYVFGVLGLLWSIPWFLLVRDRPEIHPNISAAELAHITANASTIKTTESLKVPWFQIFTSIPFWSLFIFAFGDGIGFFTLFTEIPTYLKNIQHFDMASNGLLSALPYMAMIISTPIFGFIASLLGNKNMMSTVAIRKVFTAIGLYGSCLSLVAMCFVNCNSTLAIVFLCLSVSINGAKYCGALISEQDIAPNFAGVLKGLVNAVGSAMGIVAPLITGAITSDNQTLSAWRTVFGISAVTYFVAGSVFVIFGSADLQPWNEPKKKKDDERH